MKTLKYEKKFLLDNLEKNRKQHIEDYKEAVNGYKTDAVAALRNKIEELSENPVAPLQFHLVIPRSYEKEYNVAIEMLKHSIEDTIEVSQEEFQCFVLDDWDWKDTFSNVSAFYNKRNTR